MKKYMLAFVSLLALSGVANADTGFDTWETNFSKQTEQSDQTERTSSRKSKTETVSYSGGETGLASYYWQPQAVACGGRLNPNALTAAHQTHPCGSRVLVRNLRNGSTVTVTINDRGPYVAGRIIDLSRAAAQQIGMVNSGLTRVSIQRM